jgi:conjugal transfer pilus assembly protein TraI
VPITAANKQLTLALPAFKLDAPMRLNSVVRDGLAQIIDTMNQGGKAAACTVSTGVFVPLTEFASRKIEVPFVLSSLTEAKMLVLCDSEPTITRDFAGAAQLGLVIHPSFVAGLDASDFDLPE